MIYFVDAESHEDLEFIWGSKLRRASDKGYPDFYDNMRFWVLMDGEKAIAYTGAYVYDNRFYCFVGNTYVRKEWRSKGLHKALLRKRNSELVGMTKLAILNPLQGITHERLESVVSSLGYTKVESFEDVQDCLNQQDYNNIAHHNIWRLDNDSGENEEE